MRISPAVRISKSGLAYRPYKDDLRTGLHRRRRIELAGFGFRGNVSHRVEQLRATTEVDRQAEPQAGVLTRKFDRLVDLAERAFRKPVRRLITAT